jgi:DNA-binding MarR family transcriptional regulator
MPLQVIPNVHRATHRIGLYIAECPGLSVSQGEAHILAHLHTQPDSTVAEVHRALHHRRSTLTSILDRLEARKLITRETDPADRRSFRVRLTAKGIRAAAAVHKHLETLERKALRGFTPAQIRTFTDVITRLAGEPPVQ